MFAGEAVRVTGGGVNVPFPVDVVVDDVVVDG